LSKNQKKERIEKRPPWCQQKNGPKKREDSVGKRRPKNKEKKKKKVLQLQKTKKSFVTAGKNIARDAEQRENVSHASKKKEKENKKKANNKSGGKKKKKNPDMTTHKVAYHKNRKGDTNIERQISNTQKKKRGKIEGPPSKRRPRKGGGLSS